MSAELTRLLAVDVLMYHSLSAGSGPTCIAPSVFRQQMATLAECGCRVASLVSLLGWLRGEVELPARTVVLTFDDGFADFADVAFPELQRRGWPATVFLPAAKVGGCDDWEAANAPRRKLMSWNVVRDLASAGIDFGAHGVSHVDLTSLSLPAARDEVANARGAIEEKIGRPVVTFAAPFGRTNEAVRLCISQSYLLAAGTRLARVRREADRWDLPRIETWYYRDPTRWRNYLTGRGAGHFLLRRTLRAAGQLLRAGSPR